MRDDRELTPEQLAAFGAELDALRQRTLADLGADDARYIRRVRAAVRVCCWSGRALLMFGWLPPTWLLGSLLLGLGKILENMELGHNVMHGQYDWMNDPEFAGRAYEWDIAGPSDFWRHTHNHIHHTYTNVLGKDDDVGYGVVRLFPEQRWKPFYRWQPLWVTLQALLFQYAVAIQHLRLDKYAKGRLDKAELMPLLRRLRAKLGRQWTKDYLLFPLLGLFAGGFGAVFVGNLLANVLRNLWTFTVIFCGHFTEKAVVFRPRCWRDPWPLVPAPVARLQQPGGRAAVPHPDRQPQPPDRASSLPGPAGASLRRAVPRGPRNRPALRADLQQRTPGTAILTVLRRIWVYRLPPRAARRGAAEPTERSRRPWRGRSGAGIMPPCAPRRGFRPPRGVGVSPNAGRPAPAIGQQRRSFPNLSMLGGCRPGPVRPGTVMFSPLVTFPRSTPPPAHAGRLRPVHHPHRPAPDPGRRRRPVVGGLMASYYFGLVCGGKFGHKLIASFGHIRSYVACAGIATVTVLLHALVDQLEVWLLLRFITGAVMMNQYMVIESWLNEQAESHQRGKVFAGYMVAVDLGLVLGQGLLALSPTLDYKPLLLVAICFASCLIPLAMTRRVHPAKLVAAPLEVRFFWQRVPQALGTIFIAGLMVGAFYGLAPVYANRNGLDASQSSFFVGMCIVAGFCAQWPLGWLSDRLDRSWLIRGNAVLLCLASIPMWGLVTLPYWLLLANGFVTGMLLFTLYPLAVALANDHVEQPRRVALSAMLLTTYGVGACIGPLVAGALMRHFGPGLFYMLVSGYAVLLVFWVQPKRVTGEHRVDEAPLQHVAMPDTVSPMAATLDPRVEEVPEELVVEAPANIGRSDGEPDAGEKPAQS